MCMGIIVSITSCMGIQYHVWVSCVFVWVFISYHVWVSCRFVWVSCHVLCMVIVSCMGIMWVLSVCIGIISCMGIMYGYHVRY